MKRLMLILLLLLNALLVNASFTIDTEIISLDISKDSSERITVNIENNLEENLSLEIGIAGKATRIVKTEKSIYLKPKEEKELVLHVKTFTNTEEGIYSGELVLSSKNKTVIVPVEVKVIDKLKDALQFNIVPSRNSLEPNEELQVLVQFDYFGDKEFEGTLTVSLFNKATRLEELQVGDAFLADSSFTKKVYMYIPPDLPSGDYRIIAIADAIRGIERWIFTADSDLSISTVEMPAPKKANFILWFVLVFIVAGFFVLGTQVYHFEYAFRPWEKVEMMKKRAEESAEQVLKEGNYYIIEEKGTEESFKLFLELVKEGYKGLVISRINPMHLIRQYDMTDVELRWLSSMEGPNVIGPTDIEGIHDTIEEFMMKNARSVVLLDGVQYLVVNVNLKQVALLLEYLKDRISTLRTIFIAPVNLYAFDRKERESLTADAIIFDPAKGIISAKKGKVKHFEKKLEVPETLVNYIKTHLDREHPRNVIEGILTSHGWPRHTVREAFRIAPTEKEKISEGLEERKKEAILFEEEKIEKIVNEMMSELTGEEKEETIKEEKDSLSKVRDDLLKIKKSVTRASGKGLNTSRLEMQLSLLSTDIEMVRITKDEEQLKQIQENIKKIKLDLKELETQEAQGDSGP